MGKSYLIVILGVLLIGGAFGYSVSQELSAFVLEEPFLVINHPTAGEIVQDRQVLINISFKDSASIVDMIQIKHNDDPFRSICRNCKSYLDYKPFDDGFNVLTARAVIGTTILGEANVSFIVDTKEPRIKKTEPKKDFASGWFSIEFQEENPTSLDLTYGNSITGFRNSELDLDLCIVKGNSLVCEKNVDLSDFSEEEISYWFNLTDIVGNSEISKIRSVKVDFDNPRINSFDVVTGFRTATFKLNITEPNFEEAVIIDHSVSNPQEKRLCSKLSNGVCESKKFFSPGQHDVSVFVRDKAGNEATIEDFVFII